MSLVPRPPNGLDGMLCRWSCTWTPAPTSWVFVLWPPAVTRGSFAVPPSCLTFKSRENRWEKIVVSSVHIRVGICLQCIACMHAWQTDRQTDTHTHTHIYICNVCLLIYKYTPTRANSYIYIYIYVYMYIIDCEVPWPRSFQGFILGGWKCRPCISDGSKPSLW